MENQSEKLPVASEPILPVLDYGRMDREKAGMGDSICAAIAMGLGIVMLLLSVSIMFQFLSLNAPEGRDGLVWAAILLLLLLGVASATRSAWFYLGGWANSPDGGKRVRWIVRPWRWGSCRH